MLSRGLLYVATGAQRYIDAAVEAATRTREVMPRARICLASDSDVPHKVFDSVIHLSSDDGFRAKILGMQQAPFRQTVFLDADTYLLGPVDELFDVLETFDLAVAHAPNRCTLPLNDVPTSFPEFNTGVVAFRSGRRTRKFLAQWLRSYDRLVDRDPPSKDQPSFRETAFRSKRTRVATLTPEWNLRFTMAAAFSEPVRVLHGYPAHHPYEAIGRELNRGVESGHAQVAMIAGKVYGWPLGEPIGQYATPITARLREQQSTQSDGAQAKGTAGPSD